MSKMDQREERRYTAGEVRLAEKDRGGGQMVAGYAARFGELSDDLGGFYEIIEPGFFDGVLDDDVRALWQHDARYVFGRTKARTLILRADEQGLWYAADPPQAGWAQDALESIRRGDVTQSSFGFSVAEDAWEKLADGTVVRRLVRASALYDVSPVTFPAYPTTSATARDKAAALRAQAAAETTDDDAGEDEDAGRRLAYNRNLLTIMEQ